MLAPTVRDTNGIEPADERLGRHRLTLVATGACLLALTAIAPAASADQFPGPPGANPHGRAYEMVSPLEKGGGDIDRPISDALPATTRILRSFASAAGDAVGFGSSQSFGEPAAAPGNSYYVARRAPAGWTTTNVSIPVAPNNSFQSLEALHMHSEDFSKVLLRQLGTDPGLVPGADTANGNVYVRSTGPTPSYELVTTSTPSPGGGNGGWLEVVGASNDLSRVFFESTSSLSPPVAGPPPVGVNNLYAYSGGSLSLVGILPDGSVAPGGAALGGFATNDISRGFGRANAVSPDGSRVVFKSPGSSLSTTVGQLYLRDLSGMTTTWVSEPAADAPAGQTVRAAIYQGAAHRAGPAGNGTVVFFTSQQKLTADATTGTGNTPTGRDLYRYDASANGGAGQLTDISIDTNDPNGANVQGVLGYSDDGSRIYFVALGTIVAGQGTSGQRNLYVWEDDGTSHGAVRYIATLRTTDSRTWTEPSVNGATKVWVRNARVSPDGRFVAFLSGANPALTDAGYDTAGLQQAYLYDAVAGTLTCASCKATGGPATAAASFLTDAPEPDPRLTFTRNVSDSGRLYFQTAEPLVGEDVNGKQDVYEYEAGQARLISSGRDSTDSYFADASASGNDVFFLTNERLVPQDTDNFRDMYDARVGGGIPVPPVEAPCALSLCQGGGGQAPTAPALPTTAPSGVGNATPPPPDQGGGDRLPQEQPASVEAVVNRAARRRAARRGRLRVAVRVSEAGTVRVMARANVGRSRARKRVGSASRIVTRQGTVRLTVKLSKRARRHLARKERLRLRLTVRHSEATNPEHLTITLRRPNRRSR